MSDCKSCGKRLRFHGFRESKRSGYQRDQRRDQRKRGGYQRIHRVHGGYQRDQRKDGGRDRADRRRNRTRESGDGAG